MLFCYELGNAVLIAVFQQLEYAAVLVVDVIEHVHGVLLYRIGVDLAQQFVFAVSIYPMSVLLPHFCI